MSRRCLALAAVLVFFSTAARADVGDPQVRTDHPWYPGELACSTFERLFTAQADQYERVVGVRPKTDEQKALAAWMWRNTHYFHAEDAVEDLWAKGFRQGGETKTREYWTGQFAYGFSLCGTTHAQWAAEFEALLGHNRGRVTGVDGHNSFEAFLTGGPYGDGKWVLLDHDISTVIFDKEGKSLLSIAEIKDDWKRLTDRNFMPEKQHGWLVCGLHPNDGGVYQKYSTVEYLPGYAGPPPMVHLRRGETLRRYLQPGLEDGKTFVFWGANHKTGDVPGPERAQTWVNQPEKMLKSKTGCAYTPGQARFANAVYTYKPDFASDNYKEGTIDEADDHVTFEFTTPYIIGSTPANATVWGVYDAGGRNGLVLHGSSEGNVSLSVDRGQTWQDCGAFRDGLDLTDRVKGRRQYWIKFHVGAKALARSGLTLTTVCQAAPGVMPRLADGGSEVTFAASGRALASAGPNVDQARGQIVAGGFGTPQVTMAVNSPHKEKAVAVYASAQVASGSPPRDTKYRIEYSTDAGKTWKSVVKDWTITRRGDEPKDFWSQSFCWGAAEIDGDATGVQVRFANDGGRTYTRCEVHLAYQTGTDATKATFAWTDADGPHQAAHEFAAGDTAKWKAPTGKNTVTRWVEFEAVKK